ncbi:hypothetical protein ACFPOI_57805 [Nonomuraea angiospora]|uniref:Transposase n=1 Tax=Nonomuraea angiospora TaxID=46172 RepID=A0ABR9LSF1_9ACTN|nr:hypothetical protein [Nonomuraea angiospora]MBE1583197.1 hypothetical protein [Nonomuraea angiospora]
MIARRPAGIGLHLTHGLTAARTTGLIDALAVTAVATLNTWKILTMLRCCPRRATAIVRPFSSCATRIVGGSVPPDD